MTTPSDITTYLAYLKNARLGHILPRYVTIGRRTYPAAWYTEWLNTPSDAPAYARGEREYAREMIYCVGMLPSVKRRGNVAFTLEGDERDWYVAGYYGGVFGRKQAVAAPNEYHPFGNMFLLTPWDVAATKIDTYERVPYRRVSMHVDP